MNDLIDDYYREELGPWSDYKPFGNYKYFEPGDKEAEAYYATLESVDKYVDPDALPRLLASLIVTCKRLQDRIEILEKERE